MLPALLVLATSLLAAMPATAFAHDDPAAQDVVQRWPGADEGDKPAPTVRTDDGERRAVPREEHPRNANPPAPAAPAPVATARAAQPQPAPANDQRADGGRARGDNPQTGGAVERGSRPRDGNPQTGVAVPRESRPAPAPQSRVQRGDGRNVYVGPPVRNYYYYPRQYYPYGYGAFGLGYFYYDPYTWYPPSYYGYGYGGGYGGYDPYGGYGGGYGGFYSTFDVGEVRLRVTPRVADVYVNGYYAGRVDDYDGTFQALKLDAGAYHIQITAPGYTPLDVDIRIDPGRKITYRGDLRPDRP
jgi:hypothetical protein